MGYDSQWISNVCMYAWVSKWWVQCCKVKTKNKQPKNKERGEWRGEVPSWSSLPLSLSPRAGGMGFYSTGITRPRCSQQPIIARPRLLGICNTWKKRNMQANDHQRHGRHSMKIEMLKGDMVVVTAAGWCSYCTVHFKVSFSTNTWCTVPILYMMNGALCVVFSNLPFQVQFKSQLMSQQLYISN